ncbi:TPA: hypothetical protein ACTYAS_002938 [Enterobacter kobei]
MKPTLRPGQPRTATKQVLSLTGVYDKNHNTQLVMIILSGVYALKLRVYEILAAKKPVHHHHANGLLLTGNAMPSASRPRIT